MEGGAFAPQPRAGRPGIGAEQLLDQGMEIRAVIQVDEMRDLVRDGRPADEFGREDQPPAVADRAARSSSCPSARPDRRRRPATTMTPALRRKLAGLAVEQRRAPAPSASAGRARSSPSAGPPTSSRPSLDARSAAAAPDPSRSGAARRRAASIAARRERRALGDGGERRLDPVPVPGRPGQRAPLRDPRAAR